MNLNLRPFIKYFRHFPSIWFGGLLVFTYLVFNIFNELYLSGESTSIWHSLNQENFTQITNTNLEWLIYLTIFITVVLLYLISLSKKLSFNFPLNILFTSLFYLVILHQIIYYENLIMLFVITALYTLILIRIKKIYSIDKILTHFIFNFFIFFLALKLIIDPMNIGNLIFLNDPINIGNLFFLSGIENKIISLNHNYFSKNFFYYLTSHSFFINIFKFLFFFFFFSLFFLLAILINFDKKKFNNNNYYFLYLLIPAILFFLESFSTYQFFYREGGGAIAHWQPYIGTLELMSQGGYLLWDTPSQYGFLSIIFPYILSFGSAWQSFYVINALFVFIFSFQVFFIIWNNGGFYRYIISLLASLSLVFYLNAGPSLNNVNQVPSDGAYRFFWFTTILIILFKIKHFQLTRQFWIILPLWIIGFFWSPESAFYTTAAIIPFIINYFVKSNLSFFKKIILCSIYPLAILLIVIFISFYYLLRLGHLPDFYSFVEFAMLWISGTSDTSQEPFNLNGPILLLSFLLSIILIIYKDNIKNDHSYLILSVFFSLGASSSYFVAQSIDANLNTQLVYFILGLILILNFFEWKNYKAIINPLLIIIILSTFMNPRIINHFYDTLTNQDYLLKNVYFEKIDEIENILTEIDDNNIPVTIVQSGRHFLSYSPKKYYNSRLNKNLEINSNIWLPFKVAFPLYKSLSNERRVIYLRRWLEKRPFNQGWFISPKKDIWLHEAEKSLIKSLHDEQYILYDKFEKDTFKAMLFKKM